jgi:hypothetical protein
MLGLPARLVAFGLASLLGAAATFVACGLQTSGLSLGGSGSGGRATASSDAAGTAGEAGHATGGTGGAPADAGQDAAEDHDAGRDAAPKEAGPTAYASCKDWLNAEPDAKNGVYSLFDTALNVYPAYCDMEDDGGGWTLVLKINGDNMTFAYGDARWTNTQGYNADLPALDTNEAKLASFWSVPFTALRVGMIDPTDFVLRWLDVAVGGTSLLELITSDGGTTTTLGKGAWEGLLASGSIQTNCNWEGINADGRVRVGMIGDDTSPQCDSPDSFIGFGANPSSFEMPNVTCGNTAHYYPDNGDRSTAAFGYLMVR